MQTNSADTISRATAAGDPAGRLPPRARAKFAALRAAAEDAGAAARDLAERQAALGQRRLACCDYVNRLRESDRRGSGRTPPSAPLWRFDIPVGVAVEHFNGPPDAKQVAAAEADLVQVEAEFRELGERIAAHKRRQTPIVARISQWLRGLPLGVVLTDLRDLPALEHGARPTLAAIEGVRADVARLQELVAAIGSAPIPASEARAITAAEVEAMAARGAPDLLRTIELGRPPGWPLMPLHQLGGLGGGARADVVDASALFAWVFREELLDRLNAEIDEVADDENALSATERQDRDQTARRQLLDAERLEELLIAEGEKDGLMVPRRADASIVAVLGLAPFPEGGRDLSPMHRTA